MLSDIGDLGGIKEMIKNDAGFRHGVYIYQGKLVNTSIGDYFNEPAHDINLFLSAF
jgi:alanine dehydrogenase